MFLRKEGFPEDGELVLYEVEPQTDKIIKVTQPEQKSNVRTRFILM